MSPLWRDELSVVFAPRVVELARRKAGLRPRVAATAALPADVSSPSWAAPLQVLLGALDDNAWRCGQARVLLSNHFLRYVALPANAGLNGVAEKLEFARFQLRNVHGAKAEQWAIALTREADLAVAMDTELREALRAAFAGRRMRLGALEPLFGAGYNRWRGRIGRGAWAFALAERDRLTVGLNDGRRWEAIDNRRLADGSAAALGIALAQCLAGHERRRVYLVAPGRNDAVDCAWPLEALAATPLAGEVLLSSAVLGDA